MPDPFNIDIKINKDEASRSVDQLFNKLKSIGEPVKAIKTVLEKLGLDTAFNTANKAILEAKEKLSEFIDSGTSTSEMFNVVNERTKLMNEAFTIMSANAQQASEAFTDIENEVDPLNNTLEDLGTEAKKAGDSLGDVGNEFENMIDPANEVKDKLNKIGDELDNAGKKAEKSKKMFGEFAIGINQYVELGKKAISLLSQPLEKAGQFETMQMQLEVVMGSAEKAKARFKELADFTKGTTFEVGQVVEAGKELQSLGRYSKETLTTLSNLAMGSGKSLDQITKAYTALVKGKKNMAMELFRDIGITTQDFIKATGKGMDKAKGVISASSKEMINALGQIVKNKNFEEMIEKQSQTFEGLMGSLKDGWDQFLAEFGMTLLPMVKALMQGLLPIIEVLKNNIQTFKTVVLTVVGAFLTWTAGAKILTATLLKDLWSAIIKNTTALKSSLMPALAGAKGSMAQIATSLKTGLVSSIKSVGLALKGLFLSNPIGLILTGLTALYGAFKMFEVAKEDALKREIETSKIQLDSLKSEKDKMEVKKQESEANKVLLDQYVKIAKSGDKGKLKELKKIGTDLNKIYPNLNINTETFGDKLGEVEKQAKKTAGEIIKYTKSLTGLDSQIAATEAKFLAKSTDLAKENFLKAAMEGVSSFKVWITKGTVNEDLKKQIHDVYYAQTKEQIEKAHQELLKAFINLDYIDDKGIVEGRKALDEFIEARKRQNN